MTQICSLLEDVHQPGVLGAGATTAHPFLRWPDEVGAPWREEGGEEEKVGSGECQGKVEAERKKAEEQVASVCLSLIRLVILFAFE